MKTHINPRILGVSLILGLTYWVSDALVDAFLLREGPFLGLLLLDIPTPLALFRLGVLALFLILGVVASFHFSKPGAGTAEAEVGGRVEEGTGGNEDSESRFREMAELLPEAVFETDLTLRLTYANRRAFDLFGYSEEDFRRGISALDTLTEEGKKEALDSFQSRMGGGDPGMKEYTAVRKDGTPFPILFHASLILQEGKPSGLRGIIVDLSERVDAREKLIRSEERLRLATKSGRIGVWEYLPATDHLEWDDLMHEMHGVSQESPVPGIRRWRDRIHPADVERAEGEFMAAMASEETPFDTEFRIFREGDGAIRHIRGMAGFIRDGEGKILRAIGTNWDITEAKTAREALEASEEKFRSVIEQSNDAIYIIFEDRFELVNRRFCDLMETTQEEVAEPEFSFWNLVAEESRPLILERHEKRTRGEHVPDLYEFAARTKTGKVVQVEASVTQIVYQGGMAVLGFLRDVTEQKSLQIQLNQAQKMESIGRLSGGVAHDLNNLLTPIIGYAELLRDDLDLADERRESAEEIVRAGFRSRDLVRQLLAFSRQQTLDFKATDLNQLVLGFENLIRRTIREDIEIRISPASTLPFIRGDKGQLEQVVMNLAVNAQDAMPEGGLLHIETAETEFDEEFARSRAGVVPGRYAMLALSDTGMGMDRDTQARIFEPFFTTKETGKGTGLGLATVYGIVKQHGGNIWVYSEPENGTTFRCYFPLAHDAVTESVRPSKPEAPTGGSEVIMVVEDEELVRNLAVGILKRGGYEVLSAEDAEDCLRTLEGPGPEMDLLLTDVVLPGMNGRELYRQVSQEHPASRVLFMSGHSDDVVTHRGVLEEGINFIQKPFSVHALNRKVREVLDEG